MDQKELLDLLKDATSQLIRSNHDKKHPFRSFALATINEKNDQPELRTVILRKFTPDWTILFFTDSRSPKINQIRINPNVSALFYHPRKKMQIRIAGMATEMPTDSEEYKKYCELVSQSYSISDYQTNLPPGSVYPGSATMSKDLHFSICEIQSQSIDLLMLNRNGHVRARYEHNGIYWVGTKLVP